ncbi:MFS transporter [Vibrio porteresiae]|uniref:MFS transporter n=1 Tax=Vibrio porteresiae DSM 19223 TaxID=1123496 RepID=A0ABZ0QJJ5_9VIBR|nr:MFS transporter [Vibrio porteresiae]WPC75616.1 MFS transporter [Vibrio porteresiae DSM 19223]
MNNTYAVSASPRISIPVIALTLYAIASGYLMSLIPLMLPVYGLDSSMANWLASAFYIGHFLGAMCMEKFVHKTGHRNAFMVCLAVLFVSSLALPWVVNDIAWLFFRFVAGIAVAGVFVVVESWLLHGDEKGRAKRLGIYMVSLYGGTAVGQLGIASIGVDGLAPFVAIGALLLIATYILRFAKGAQPSVGSGISLSLRQISKLSHPAIIGCLVSGLATGAIYGLMPLELEQRGISHTDLGTLMAIVILGAMAIQPIVPWLSNMMGRTLLMALLCLLGAAAAVVSMMNPDLATLSICLFMVGVSTFALYPIAINLACANLDSSYIVSATQAMLFSYSVGSVLGPMAADWFMQGHQGMMAYLFITLMATCVYMLMSSVKTKHQWVAGK